MAVLTSKELIEKFLCDAKADLIINEFEKLEEEKYQITLEDKVFNIVFDGTELDGEGGEVSNIISVGEGFTLTSTTISFILSDEKSSKKFNVESSSEIDFGGIYKVKLKKDKEAYGVLFYHLIDVIDFKKARNAEDHLIRDLVKDYIIICVADYSEADRPNEEVCKKLINSSKVQMSFHNHIYLKELNEREVLSFNGDNNEIINIPNAKLYNDLDPLTFFLFAESVEYSHLKFLEYYHILEYYFLHKRMKDVEKVIKDIVVLNMINTTFNKEDSYYQKLMEVFDLYFVREDKNTAELQQLEYVIKRDIGYPLIVGLLDGKDMRYLENKAFELPKTGVSSLKGSVLITKNTGHLRQCDDESLMDLFCDQLAERIYKVRNFIVHSKKYEKKKVFTPTIGNLSLLEKEVELIRILAYALMNKY